MNKFGSYEILKELKSGGMGAVLLARRRGPGNFEQLVAIKTIRREYASAEAVRAMFLDEAAILARVNHPGIATVHDFGEETGVLYMAMEYVAGISFRALGDLEPPPHIAACVIAEACRGLHAAHEVRDTAGQLLGVVHRDISPDNLMLGYDGHVRVIDFGIALVKNRQSPVTEFGTVKGKPPYMSPEQVKNEVLDRRSDVFSLAVVLHELLTGEALFEGDSIYAIARSVEHQEILRPSVVANKQLPIGLDAVVMTALQRDPAQRTATAAALAEQLEQVISNTGDETLEAWAERELATPRNAHRTWLADVVAGHDAPKTQIGRPTGSVTALGPLAQAGFETTPPAPSVLSLTDAELVPPRRRMGPVLLGLALLIALGGAVIFFAMRSRSSGSSHDAAPIALADAAIDQVAPVSADAAELLDAIAIDAGARDAAAIDAPPRRITIDAGPRTIPVDATFIPDAAATGTGRLIARHHKDSSSYVEVYVDGVLFGKTPVLNAPPLATGKHVVVMKRPDTGQVVLQREITLDPNEVEVVVEPTPH